MSKAERIKAEIAFHEKMFFVALAVIMGVVGWSASNYVGASQIMLMLVIIVMTGASAFGLYQYRVIKQLIEDLEDA